MYPERERGEGGENRARSLHTSLALEFTYSSILLRARVAVG